MLRMCSQLLSSVQEVTLFLSSFGHPSMQFTDASSPELSSITSCLLVLRAAFVQFGGSVTES